MPTIHALLIGINAYPRNPLSGCINDVADVKCFFDELILSNEAWQMNYRVLLAPHPDDQVIINKVGLNKIGFDTPSRANIIQAFSHFDAGKANTGDVFFFYFSGHGSQQDAPEGLNGDSSSAKLETILALDSRQEGGHDLADKELRYLIWKATHSIQYQNDQPDIHFLAVMDCCHAGSGVRTDEVRSRMEKPAPAHVLPLEKMIGYLDAEEKGFGDTAFMSRLKSGWSFKAGRFVQLAAARDDQTAKEKNFNGEYRGAFTYSLFEVLRNGGLQLSYRHLLQKVDRVLHNRVSEQQAQIDVQVDEDADLQVLAKNLLSPQTIYYIGQSRDGSEWLLNAGATSGIAASSAGMGDSILRLEDGRSVKIVEARATESVLDMMAFNVNDEGKVFAATLIESAANRISIGLNLPEAMQNKLLALEGFQNPILFRLQNSGQAKTADYLVSELDACYVLHLPDQEGEQVQPLFQRQKLAENFLIDLEFFARWRALYDLKSPNITLPPIELEVLKIEGKALPAVELDDLIEPNQYEALPLGGSISLAHQEINGIDLQPAFALRLKSSGADYFVRFLYLDSLYGIQDYTPLIDKVTANAGAIDAKFRENQREFKLIPVYKHADFKEKGVEEIEDLVKIIVSTTPFYDTIPVQNNLELDQGHEKERNRAPGRSPASAPAGKDAWWVIEVPVKLRS
jgi:hypothetical protein